MHCPKRNQTTLIEQILTPNLAAQYCPDCEGYWIPAEAYEAWQASQHGAAPEPATLVQSLDMDFVPAALDRKAALCPECRHYLARARVGLKQPFYLERCPNCGGIWCDRGEWQVLEQLGLHADIEQLFSSEWQARVRELEQQEQERRATIDKLGPELANRVFELAEYLRNHPNGDFGVAYLMRRFDH